MTHLEVKIRGSGPRRVLRLFTMLPAPAADRCLRWHLLRATARVQRIQLHASFNGNIAVSPGLVDNVLRLAVLLEGLLLAHAGCAGALQHAGRAEPGAGR